MPRKPRLNIPNGVYHVMNRGIERRNIVNDDIDRGEWKRLFVRTAVQRGWRAYVRPGSRGSKFNRAATTANFA